MSNDEIKKELFEEVDCNISIHSANLDRHKQHILFALDMIDDIENYNDTLFVQYSRRIDRMRKQ